MKQTPFSGLNYIYIYIYIYKIKNSEISLTKCP